MIRFNHILAVGFMLTVTPLAIASVLTGEVNSALEAVSLLSAGPVMAAIMFFEKDIQSFTDRYM